MKRCRKMGEITKEKVMTLLEAGSDGEGYARQFFEYAPEWLMDTFQMVDLEENTIFIRENTKVELIYILLKGAVKATDYRVFGITYDFMRFHPMMAFGSMEILLGQPLYKTTLITVTPCVLLVTARSNFERWLSEDMKAYRLESNTMVSYLLEQGRRERIFLFMQGTDRVMYLFMQLFEESGSEEKNRMFRITRQEMSDYTGLCVKTINRAMMKLEEEGYIGRMGTRIVISVEQYREMKAYIMDKIG